MADINASPPKKESIDHVTNPTILLLGDTTAENIVNFQKIPEENKTYGIGCTKMFDATPTFNLAECEYEIKHQEINAGIVFGRDRPSDKFSGYGGTAWKKSSCIDIVAGRMGPEAATVNKENEIIFCENNFTMDAARIYLSQRTDIDSNFKIRPEPGIVRSASNVSGIGIKSDCVRIIGRQDIKIVTGTDLYDSRGYQPGTDYKIPKKIMLIGDNRSDLIQPMVKGENLQALLIKIFDILHNITSTISQFNLHQSSINQSAVNHRHRDRVNINKFGFLSEGLYEKWNEVMTTADMVERSLIAIDKEIVGLKTEYILLPNNDLKSHEKNILSNYNFCN